MRPAGLVFPGGGIFFWFQAGAISALSRRLTLSKVPVAGASAGALAATLAACESDVDDALHRALSLSEAAGVFERGPWGLRGVWGPMIEEWLDQLLPSDAAARCSGRVRIDVSQPRLFPPGLKSVALCEYEDKADLVSANMASVHIPLFIDGAWTRRHRGRRCVDGSIRFLGKRERLMPPGVVEESGRVRIASVDSHLMRARYNKPGSFLKLSSVDAVREMMEWGAIHVEEMDAGGKLDALDAFRR
ncbi:hypothetical protein AB1Y20_019812 [Prymnesium parvum]|uniref:PNPLA domain-containing protein n=1 Tax=Prymnesium parvum TaxID=97485 RepID=A0AB34JVF1_PRYPA|mmetsp:Transcript_1669/g.4204  ORF Transcript_1669/g.4204 Transcript_1669/m.4204 type:complete len:246 (-) Transcript_1669:422-1159(-)